jgi:hypothetical protein
VLGGVLVLVLLIVYACSGSDDTDRDKDGNGAQPTASPTAYPTDDVPSESPSGDGSADDDPGPDGGSGNPGDPGGPGDAAGGQPGGDAGSDGDFPTCANSDLEIAPKPADTQTPEGARLTIRLVIRNTSDRPCERDVGADRQEIRVMDGDDRIWSSDHCSPEQGSYVEVLQPGERIDRFWVVWDGRTSAPKCEGDRAVVREGEYSLIARLGDLLSDPVKITVVDVS